MQKLRATTTAEKAASLTTENLRIHKAKNVEISRTLLRRMGALLRCGEDIADNAGRFPWKIFFFARAESPTRKASISRRQVAELLHLGNMFVVGRHVRGMARMREVRDTARKTQGGRVTRRCKYYDQCFCLSSWKVVQKLYENGAGRYADLEAWQVGEACAGGQR